MEDETSLLLLLTLGHACQVEDRTSLVSELSVMASQEKVALDQCRDLLAKAAKLQVPFGLLSGHLLFAYLSGHLSHFILFFLNSQFSSNIVL